MGPWSETCQCTLVQVGSGLRSAAPAPLPVTFPFNKPQPTWAIAWLLNMLGDPVLRLVRAVPRRTQVS